MTTFRLPDLGEGLTESEIVTWQVAEGDEVELNQVLAEVETAKAVVDLPSPYAGRIARLHAEPGQTVAVGAPLVDFVLGAADDGAGPEPVTTGSAGAAAEDEAADDGAGEATIEAVADDEVALEQLAAGGTVAQEPPSQQATPGPEAPAQEQDGAPVPPAPAPERQSVLVGYGPKIEGDARPSRRARSFETTPYQGRSEAEAQRPTPKAMPPVRALAASRGVDLGSVSGSGPDGLILRADVEAASGTRAASADAGAGVTGSAPADAAQAGSTHAGTTHAGTAPARTAQPASTTVPLSGLRKHTAQAMTDSAFTAPHAAVFCTVDVTASLDLLKQLKSSSRGGATPSKVSFLALAARAVMLAAARTPAANAHFDSGGAQIEYFTHLNLGIAVATDRGLVVAGIEDADTLGAADLTEQIADRATKAREGSLSLAELTSSTLTVSNVGVFGVDGGIPILNPGESVIVALGAIRSQPWEHQGQVALRDVVTVTVSFDHRVLDGAEASAFLADITDVLSNPAIALTR